jgi:transposase InsO family protein
MTPYDICFLSLLNIISYLEFIFLFICHPSIVSQHGNPYDNALAENFFSILKTECIHRVKLQTYEDARRIIDEYIYFYNNQRIQLKTKLTPLEKRCQYVA